MIGKTRWRKTDFPSGGNESDLQLSITTSEQQEIIEGGDSFSMDIDEEDRYRKGGEGAQFLPSAMTRRNETEERRRLTGDPIDHQSGQSDDDDVETMLVDRNSQYSPSRRAECDDAICGSKRGGKGPDRKRRTKGQAGNRG